MSSRDENKFCQQRPPGMTLVELLVVIAVVAVLLGLLLPVIGRPGHPSKILIVRRDLGEIENGIIAYRSTYSALPVTTKIRQFGKSDFTFGTAGLRFDSTAMVTNPEAGYQAHNAELIAILMARKDNVFNPEHVHNPQRKQFLNAKIASVDGKWGVGRNDGVYRDPWGMPYIISLDLNDGGHTQDAFYSLAKVSQMGTNGLNGLRSLSGSGANDYAYRGPVMIWSFGPDRKADPNLRADEGVNADNILSWR
ncbi:MAG: hypothetical protein K0Q55_1809 [Verrucomicrobia bacterium]|nr:hypothetical protein [Verrucomicrobiota bacterium]